MSSFILAGAYILRKLADIIVNIYSYFVDASSFPPQVPSLLAGYDNGLLYMLNPCAFLSRCRALSISGGKFAPANLQLYLSHLPDSLHLPEPIQATYPFDLFEISPEDLEDYGETGAVNRELEIAFGSRHNGPIVFVERGPVLVQVVDILRTYLQKDPNSAVLQKWVDDLTTSAKLCFSHDNIPLPTASGPGQPMELRGTSCAGGPSTTRVVAPSTASKKSLRSVQKLDSKKISDTNDLAYEDIPELEDPRKGGAKLLPLLLQVSVHCHVKDKPSEERARCIGSRLCHTSWKWPRARQRILDHASKCGYIEAKLRDAAVVELARKAAGPAIVIPDERVDGDQPSSQKSHSQVAATTVTSSKLTTATSSASQKMMESFQAKGKKVMLENGDYAVMKFFVCCGIPPSVANAKEFKEMVAVLAGQRGYTPPSSTKLEKTLIVNEVLQ
ncbi:hypothetical protein L210DRAFT_3640229 [Boletus edulis BED1]|uniref:Uncharacterized protein n=1 Tax=Boletus edulis BED1 TaxID=1328754 RepID=A0AAD4C933_BOLED|nr:hypothetical protein L210DRAFT_3640229 [Boletus edulis BED1]